MFPGIDGFHWTIGHVVFLMLFFAVVVTILWTVASAAWRTAHDFRNHHAIDLCWKADFADLPEADRRCRHELAGRVISRTCDNQFDCRSCENYSHFAVLPATGVTQDLGLDYPADRLYHRGHTWAKREADGTVSIGLDALADHLIGTPEAVDVPEVGQQLEVNQITWRVKKNGKEIGVRAPLEGTVLSIGRPENNWSLNIRPAAGCARPENNAAFAAWARGPRMDLAGVGETSITTSPRGDSAKPGGWRSADRWIDGCTAGLGLEYSSCGHVPGSVKLRNRRQCTIS